MIVLILLRTLDGFSKQIDSLEVEQAHQMAQVRNMMMIIMMMIIIIMIIITIMMMIIIIMMIRIITIIIMMMMMALIFCVLSCISRSRVLFVFLAMHDHLLAIIISSDRDIFHVLFIILNPFHLINTNINTDLSNYLSNYLSIYQYLCTRRSTSCGKRVCVWRHSLPL